MTTRNQTDSIPDPGTKPNGSHPGSHSPTNYPPSPIEPPVKNSEKNSAPVKNAFPVAYSSAGECKVMVTDPTLEGLRAARRELLGMMRKRGEPPQAYTLTMDWERGEMRLTTVGAEEGRKWFIERVVPGEFVIGGGVW